MSKPLASLGRFAAFILPWQVYSAFIIGFLIESALLWFYFRFAGRAAVWAIISTILSGTLWATVRNARVNINSEKQTQRYRPVAMGAMLLLTFCSFLSTIALMALLPMPKGIGLVDELLSTLNTLATGVLALMLAAVLSLVRPTGQREYTDVDAVIGGSPFSSNPMAPKLGSTLSTNPSFMAPDDMPKKRTTRNVLLNLPWCLIAILGVFMTFDCIAYVNDYYIYLPEPEEFVTVGENQIHFKCTGQLNDNYPPVLLAHGLLSWYIDWWRIQPQLALYTRVCSYSRAGYGYSEAGVWPRTTPQITEEMRGIVDQVGFADTGFVFVGHSFAGHQARYFYSEYPSLVKGIVFLDALYAETDENCNDFTRWATIIGAGSFLRFLTPTGLPRFIAATAGFSNLFPRLDDMTRIIYAEYLAALFRPSAGETAFSESWNFPESCEAVVGIANKTIDVPVLSVGAEFGINSGSNNTEIMELAELASPGKGSWYIVEDATHSDVLHNMKMTSSISKDILELLERANGN